MTLIDVNYFVTINQYLNNINIYEMECTYYEYKYNSKDRKGIKEKYLYK
jgi:hypothetical protein